MIVLQSRTFVARVKMCRINPTATLMECNRFVPPILKCPRESRKRASKDLRIE